MLTRLAANRPVCRLSSAGHSPDHVDWACWLLGDNACCCASMALLQSESASIHWVKQETSTTSRRNSGWRQENELMVSCLLGTMSQPQNGESSMIRVLSSIATFLRSMLASPEQTLSKPPFRWDLQGERVHDFCLTPDQCFALSRVLGGPDVVVRRDRNPIAHLPYFWNSQSLLSSGQTCLVFNHLEMQWKWKACYASRVSLLARALAISTHVADTPGDCALLIGR